MIRGMKEASETCEVDPLPEPSEEKRAWSQPDVSPEN